MTWEAISFILFLRPGHSPGSLVTIPDVPVESNISKIIYFFLYPAARPAVGRIQCLCCCIPDAFLLPRKPSPDLADIKRAEQESVPCLFPRAVMPAVISPCAPSASAPVVGHVPVAADAVPSAVQPGVFHANRATG